MTPKQQQIFIKVMQHGAACGKSDRFKCLLQYIRSNPHATTETIAAFAAFERGCGHCHESAIALEEMTDEQYWQWVQEHHEPVTA